MKYALAIASLFTGALAAKIDGGPLPANSKTGMNLLSKSRRLDEGDDQQVDMTWVQGYEIKYQGCHHVAQWNAEAEENDNEEVVRIETSRLIRFRMCPVGLCSSVTGSGCSSGYGDYIVDMNVYMNAFLQYKEEIEQEECEAFLENGNCADCEGNDDEEGCQNTCYANNYMSYCIEEEDAIRIEEYLECKEYEIEDNDDGGRRLEDAEEEEQLYYLGPYCADQGAEVLMGFFGDDTCTNFADSNGNGGSTTFATLTGGLSIPYSKQSLIDSTCYAAGVMDGDDDAAGMVLTEFAETAYMYAGKCEDELAYGVTNYPNSAACNYLAGIQMTRTNGIIITGSGSKNKVAAAFIGIFAVSFLLLGSYVYYLKSKLDRGRIHLSD